MFGDSMFDEEERMQRAESGWREPEETQDDDPQDVTAAGGLDERLKRREALARLLREVGGC